MTSPGGRCATPAAWRELPSNLKSLLNGFRQERPTQMAGEPGRESAVPDRRWSPRVGHDWESPRAHHRQHWMTTSAPAGTRTRGPTQRSTRGTAGCWALAHNWTPGSRGLSPPTRAPSPMVMATLARGRDQTHPSPVVGLPCGAAGRRPYPLHPSA